MLFNNKNILLEIKNELAANNEKIDPLLHETEQLRKVINRHDMALEDLLEEWNEKSTREEQYEERIKELSDTETNLLELFEAYMDQFFAMRRFAETKDREWQNQIELMEKNLENFRKICGISIVDKCGSPVDYNLHEVLETVETEDEGKDKTVADIYRCGYIYRGTIKRKAQVAAYKLS